MSRLTLKRTAIGVAVLSFLTGCLETSGSQQAMSVAAPANTGKSYALATATIVPDRVIAKGPTGYCIDKRSLRSRSSGGFALLAPCAALGAQAEGGEEPVLLTIQAQPKGFQGGPENASGLAKAFEDFGPLYSETGDGMNLVHLSTGGDEIIPGGEPRHWRAALSYNGYLVGLAVYSEKGGAAAGARGKELLLEFAEGVLGASPIKSVDPKLAAAETQKPQKAKLFGNFLQ